MSYSPFAGAPSGLLGVLGMAELERAAYPLHVVHVDGTFEVLHRRFSPVPLTARTWPG